MLRRNLEMVKIIAEALGDLKEQVVEERFPLRKRPRRPPWNPEFCFFRIVSV